MTIAGEHLEGRKVGERYANGLCRIDAIRNRHKKARGSNCILRVTTHHAEIGNVLPLTRRDNVRASLLDNTYELVAWSERQRSFEVRVAATPNEDVSIAGSGSENLDAHLARARIGDRCLFRQFQDLRATEPGYANVLPRHGAAWHV